MNRRLSFLLSLVVFAATCMCVCADGNAAIEKLRKLPACCEAEHAKSGPAQHAPTDHSDCRACGLKIWSAARHSPQITTHIHDFAFVSLIPDISVPVRSELGTQTLRHDYPPPPLQTLFDLNCQLLN